MIDLLVWTLVLPAALANLVLSIELIAAQLRPARLPQRAGPASPRIAILIPAHNEATQIAETIAALADAAPAGAYFLIVADNCSDATAEIARASGAEVIERQDATRVGKGHALAFGRDHLAADPPHAVLIVDADCAIAGDGISRLTDAVLASGRPVQSAYLLCPRRDRGSLTAISGFAFLVRNLVRQRGLARLGAPALLTGAGMAFPWPIFAHAPLATSDLVEDLALGIALTRSGNPPLFLADVQTWSEPAVRNGAFAQRTRWDQGFLRTALRAVPPLLLGGRWPLLWLGLHLTVPPLALLCAIDAILLAGLMRWAAASPPLYVLAASALLMLAMLALSWARFGRAQVSASELLFAPLYILWKFPIYALAMLKPERRWIRTSRE